MHQPPVHRSNQRGTPASPSASATLRPPPRPASRADAAPFTPIPLLYRLCPVLFRPRQTWTHHTVITDSGGFTYTAIREVSPGRLLYLHDAPKLRALYVDVELAK